MTSRPGKRESNMAYALKTLIVTAAVMAAAVGVKGLIFALADANSGFTIYIPAVAVAAWYRGFLGGILATLIGAMLDTFLFVQPVNMLGAELVDYRVRLLAYLAGGAAVSFLSHGLRRERDRARLESAERRANELRDAFNGIISHELRTPITAIYGGAKLLARRDRELDPATRQELIDDLEAEADRLYRLVEDLLVLSRSERGTIERSDDPVVVQRIVERVAASERPRWPGITFEVSNEASSTARGDETYVEQVLRNLLGNAAKYSPAGSTVKTIVDETVEGIRVRVLDRGAGITGDESARLFDLYYRSPATAGTTSGAGIGLFVCRALVEAMGGRVWATPRDGGGSEFGFVLRRQPEE